MRELKVHADEIVEVRIHRDQRQSETVACHVFQPDEPVCEYPVVMVGLAVRTDIVEQQVGDFIFLLNLPRSVFEHGAEGIDTARKACDGSAATPYRAMQPFGLDIDDASIRQQTAQQFHVCGRQVVMQPAGHRPFHRNVQPSAHRHDQRSHHKGVTGFRREAVRVPCRIQTIAFVFRRKCHVRGQPRRPIALRNRRAWIVILSDRTNATVAVSGPAITPSP
jgi:hypothetical protein